MSDEDAAEYGCELGPDACDACGGIRLFEASLVAIRHDQGPDALDEILLQ